MNTTAVIPCKGRLAHLQACLPLVLAQSHKSVSAIVVDYACPEKCGEWVESLKDERIKVARAGTADEWSASAARNTGIRAADADMVWLLDCDTLPPADWVEKHLPFVGVGTYVYSPGSILVTLENLQNVGGFNEMLIHGWGWEDTDLFNRFHATGMRRVAGESVNPQAIECDWQARRKSLVLNQQVTQFKGL